MPKKTRTLLTGQMVPELDKPVNIILTTKCPAKWVMVDLENGCQYTSTGTTSQIVEGYPLGQRWVQPICQLEIPKPLC